MRRIAALIHKYKHAWLLLYACIYLPWFCYLERTVTGNYHVMHAALDDLIPFCEYFIVPYLLWFFYVAAAVAIPRSLQARLFPAVRFLFGGMTVCLAIYTVFPNGQILRPLVFPRDNLLTDAVRTIYLADPPINVCPSIHCFNSIGVNIAIRRSELGRRHKAVRWARRS